ALVADAGDAPRTGHQVLRTAARADVDCAVRLHAASRGQLDQRPRHRIRANAEIALGEGRERGCLRTDVEPDADGYGAGAREVVLEAGEQLAEGAHSAREQQVDMLALRYPRAVLGLVAQNVGLQHHHALEVHGQRLCGREPAHPRADDDSLLANHHFPPRSIRTLPYGSSRALSNGCTTIVVSGTWMIAGPGTTLPGTSFSPQRTGVPSKSPSSDQ